MPSDDHGGGFDGDSFSETTHRSWFQRIGDSIKGVLFGLVLVIGAGAMLFWNEGRAAKTAAALNEGAGIVKSVANNSIDTANKGKLIHVSGPATAENLVRDADLGFGLKGLKLTRTVELYQWKEETQSKTETKLGGSEQKVTTYSYKKVWSDDPIDSAKFKRPQGHTNPSFPVIKSRTFAAEGAKLGTFDLGANIINRLGDGEKVAVPRNAGNAARVKIGRRARITDGMIYVGGAPSRPRIGDIRVSYSMLPLQDVSVVAQQTDKSFTGFTASNGRTILLTALGNKPPAAMFQSAQDANTALTWGLRVLGIVLMFAGFALVLGPISTIASVVPLLGNIAGFGTSLIAMISTAVLAPLIIAIAWFFYRPLLSVIVLVVGAAIVYGLRVLGKRRAAARAANVPSG